jgi:hypothetical protein
LLVSPFMFRNPLESLQASLPIDKGTYFLD